jgi:mono/diheme cytochrome c family protein/uncharacterized membrane protein
MPEIPDFTKAPWHARRTDAQLLATILEGKDEMPSWSGKISKEQARGLVAHVRSFVPTAQTRKGGRSEGFDESYRKLQEEMRELQKQGRELSKDSSNVASSKPPQSPQQEVSRPSASTAAGGSAVRQLFRQRCAKCHGADGTGNAARDRLPEIPDFSKAPWHARRTDAQLLASILDGKDEMPSWRGKISQEQARDLVAHVRAFAPTSATPRADVPADLHQDSRRLEEEVRELQARSRRLEEEVRELQARVGKPSKDAPGGAPSAPSESGPHEVAPQSAPAAPGAPTPRDLFRQRCAKCHGADGTGNAARDRLPEIPDFTKAPWHARRTDAQLLASILDGKGSEMPPHRGKISEEQARGLVAYVRSFAPATGKSGQEEQERPDSTQEARSPRGLFEKSIRWLGRFHPPTVHFPIALLMAAAVAELLRLATGQPVFDAIARYCVWFGTLTAVAAGVLGWFMGRFRLTDASWVMMTHRWLGTSTVVCAGLVLALGEVSRRPDRRRTRMCFRIMLLVLAVLVSATGFFGGAVVFGLDHYRWPQ